MRQLHKASVALFAGLVGLGWGASASASAPDGQPQGAQEEQGKDQAQPSRQPGAQRGQYPEQGQNLGQGQGAQRGLGAGVGGQPGAQGQGAQRGQPGACGGGVNIGPLPTGGAQGGFGAGIGQGVEQGGGPNEPGKLGQGAAPAPVPQYWLADASLFVANAGNAAQILANEQALGVQVPSVFGNQAQFLLASTDRAISSLSALASQAETSNPRAVPEIRSAMNQLTAAKAQAQQLLEAANAGTLGSSHEATLRSTYDHLQAAEREMSVVGQRYGALGYTLTALPGFRGGRAFGAGIGAPGAKQKAPAKTPEGGKAAPEGGAKTPEGAKPAPEAPKPAPGGEPTPGEQH